MGSVHFRLFEYSGIEIFLYPLTKGLGFPLVVSLSWGTILVSQGNRKLIFYLGRVSTEDPSFVLRSKER